MRFNSISTRNELADFLGIQRKDLSYVLYIAHTESFYRSFDIPKKSGSVRHILAPTDKLKYIQTLLAKKLFEYREQINKEQGIRTNISHGFEKDKSILTNASIHRNKRFIISFDLNDFFDSFHFGRVVGYFEKNKYFNLPHEVSVTIAQIACYKGHLPQGAPTSPIIANMISETLDYRLLKIAKVYRLDYTRYADDLTFSTNLKNFLETKNDFIKEATTEIESSGFTVNESKTRLVFKDSRQIVTGLVVNKKVNVPRIFYKETRAMLNSYYTTGEFEINGKKGTCKQLAGRLSFIDQVEHFNNKTLLKTKSHTASTLSTRERQYRDFLFYIHFLNNPKPVIITEGKTDVLYLKAALKSLQKEFPTLITKKGKNSYTYNVSFFNKTRHWEYFFDMDKDGGDALTNLYKALFLGKKSLCSAFVEKKAVFSSVPVLFLLDNEAETQRPLRKFINCASITKEQNKELTTENYTLLEPKSNSYLVSVPLSGGRKECEMEDLFTDDTLKLVINGRSFSRKDEDKTKFYNKNIFSKYIYDHYKDIDFSGFRPLLSVIEKISKQK